MLNQLQLRRRDRVSYALIDGPLTIGWIRTGIIGFGGFDDRREALAAGAAAVAMVTHWAAARRAALVPPFPTHLAAGLAELPLHVPEADAIRGADGVVGRVLAPEEVDIDLAGHGFEVSLPPGTWVAVLLEVAQRIHRGLEGTSRGAPDERTDVLEVTA
jgi:hypothetical protein